MALIAHFSTYNIPVDGLSFIMSPANALSLSFRQNLDGSAVFPGVGIEGGVVPRDRRSSPATPRAPT